MVQLHHNQRLQKTCQHSPVYRGGNSGKPIRYPVGTLENAPFSGNKYSCPVHGKEKNLLLGAQKGTLIRIGKLSLSQLTSKE